MCEFVIRGEPRRQTASTIITSEEPLGMHLHTNIGMHIFIEMDSRLGENIYI